MAVDVLCSEISISPRISFSYDLNNLQQADPDIEATQKYIINGSDEAESDFFFSIISPSKCLHEPCLADEIFSNGKILPTQIKKKNNPAVVVAVAANFCSSLVDDQPKKIRLKELLESEVDDQMQKPAEGKFFWKFRRSSSLNCDGESTGRGKGAVMKSIQFLSRSKSTGSVPNQKQSRKHRGNPSAKSDQFQYYKYGASSTASSGHKPPLCRTKSYGSGNVRIISPLLNIPIPPSYFCRPGNASLFGFSSLFSTGRKDKSTKKKAC